LGDDALWPIELDEFAKLSLPSLKRLIERAKQEGRPILMVVSVAGTTELGTIDPVDEVQAYLDELCETEGLHIWHHVDAAYGGFFRTVSSDVESVLSSRARNALGAIPSSTSTTLDPHKLGYVPYASGTFLTREKRDYYFNAFEEAPYIDFDPEVDRGPYTIEGSRSAGGAVATWMTAKIIGLDRGGYGLLLERTLRLRESLSLKLLQSGAAVRIIPANDTNILCFSCAREGEPLSVSNARTLKVYEAYSPKKNGPFIVSKTTLQFSSYRKCLEHWIGSWGGAKRDCEEIVLIRMCLMNPFFESVEMKVNLADAFVESLKGTLEGLLEMESRIAK
jgi:glutamate/tyrosine decarboxylase-like PLP-dependent enzyme